MIGALYDAALRGADVHLVRGLGDPNALPVARWTGPVDVADRALLARCAGPTLDVGCGPGRLLRALNERGIPALGVDISPQAVSLACRTGAIALRRNVFDRLPGESRWSHVLLADGNIGIGGDPVRLLTRCRQLLRPAGTVLADLDPPGIGVVLESVHLAHGRVRGDEFRWAWVDAGAIGRLARSAGLRLRAVWRIGQRWQAMIGTDDG